MNAKTIDRFRSMADKLRNDAEAKLRPRDTHTQKKLAQARSAEREGQQFIRAAVLIDAYCDAAEREQLPAVLAAVKPTKDTFLTAARLQSQPVSNGYHSYNVDKNEPCDAGEVSTALRSLGEASKTAEDVASERATAQRLEVARAVDGLRGCDIEGFFPTPEPIIKQMLRVANVRNGHRVLEPSAGLGSIVDALKASGFSGHVDALEIHHALCKIIEMKGHNPHCEDFITWRTGGYDRILMNPPFERRQAIKHIEHAFSLLAPGGVIVAILPTNHAFELRFDDMDVHPLPANCFNTVDSFRRTGVSVAMVEIKKAAPMGLASVVSHLPATVTGIANIGGDGFDFRRLAMRRFATVSSR